MLVIALIPLVLAALVIPLLPDRLRVRFMLAASLFALGIAVVIGGVVEVGPDEIGVVFNVLRGELSEEPLRPSTHFVIPFVEEVTIYSTAQQEYTMSDSMDEGATKGEDAIEALTRDGQAIGLGVTIRFRIDPAQVNTVHREWQDRYARGLIRPTVRSVTREVVGQFDLQDITNEKRSELGQMIAAQVQEKIAPQGFIVDEVVVLDIQFPEEVGA